MILSPNKFNTTSSIIFCIIGFFGASLSTDAISFIGAILLALIFAIFGYLFGSLFHLLASKLLTKKKAI